ncbi:MAG: ABC transporter ATP-binding protein [Alphaproteobacteria bacterium]
MVLALEGLGKSYGRTRALDNLSLAVADGEILALLGPTGAGKSTVMLTVAGLVRPDRGRIRLRDEDVTDLPPQHRNMASVFEGLNLLPTLSVVDNITLPLRAPGAGIGSGEIDARLRPVAEELRITHLLSRRTHGLSGGERQRVALARALIRRADILLLDEPLSALDLKLRETLRVELRSLHDRYATTIVYATHDFGGAAAVADRLALIDAGRILQVGTLDEIYSAPASTAVGALVGSPAMAVFDAVVDGSSAVLAGGALRLPLAAPVPGGRVRIGAWPEDIRLAAAPAEGLAPGNVYAVSRRGIDKAIQVNVGGDAGASSFRKAVPLALPVAQGDTIWFGLDAARCFAFDVDSGRALAAPGAAA